MCPDEKIAGLGDATIGDFWSWAYSDLLSNTVRPLFAEYLVGRCLGATDQPRVEWNYVDFVYQGKKLEVKSAAYVQTWQQNGPSVITFDIACKERPWIAETNTYAPSGRSADCYILCVHTDLDSAKCIVNDITRWDFYVMSANEILVAFSKQKTIRLSRVRKVCSPVKYSDLKTAIETVLGLNKPHSADATA
jgi:hypothetical protein